MKVVDAFMQSPASSTVRKGRVLNKLLPACAVYHKALGRWFSSTAIAALKADASHEARSELGKRASASVAVRRFLAAPAATLASFAAAGSTATTPSSKASCPAVAGKESKLAAAPVRKSAPAIVKAGPPSSEKARAVEPARKSTTAVSKPGPPSSAKQALALARHLKRTSQDSTAAAGTTDPPVAVSSHSALPGSPAAKQRRITPQVVLTALPQVDAAQGPTSVADPAPVTAGPASFAADPSPVAANPGPAAIADRGQTTKPVVKRRIVPVQSRDAAEAAPACVAANPPPDVAPAADTPLEDTSADGKRRNAPVASGRAAAEAVPASAEGPRSPKGGKVDATAGSGAGEHSESSGQEQPSPGVENSMDRVNLAADGHPGSLKRKPLEAAEGGGHKKVALGTAPLCS